MEGGGGGGGGLNGDTMKSGHDGWVSFTCQIVWTIKVNSKVRVSFKYSEGGFSSGTDAKGMDAGGQEEGKTEEEGKNAVV